MEMNFQQQQLFKNQYTVTIVLQEGNNLFPVELKLIFTCKHALCLFFIAVSM